MSSLDVRAIDKQGLRKAARPVASQELAVFIAEAAFDRAVERGGKDTSREIGGVLVGEVRVDDRGPYLAIEDTIDALHADEKGAELTFTHATWDHIHKEMDARFPDKKVVGWYHTHPGFGVFLSDRDQFIHKSFFNLPFQVALVYDPKSREHGVFAWRDNEVWRMRRYAIGDREHVWDGDRAAARAAKDKDKASDKDKRRDGAQDRDDDRDRDRERSRAPRDEHDDDRLGTLTSMVLTALVLMAVAGVAGYWIGGMGTNDAVRAMQVRLVEASQQGQQQALTAIDGELVSLVRTAVSERSTLDELELAAEAIDGAMTALTPPTVAPGAPAPPPIDRAAVLARLTALKARLRAAAEGRLRAEGLMAQLEALTRPGAALRADVAGDVARQRAGLGNLYAELATDVAKADSGRARRLLETAAHLDPGNRAQYERQLQTFAKGQHLKASDDDVPAPAPARPLTPGGAVPPPVVVPEPAAPPAAGSSGTAAAPGDTVPAPTADGGSR